jgi:hypothetical protein
VNVDLGAVAALVTAATAAGGSAIGWRVKRQSARVDLVKSLQDSAQRQLDALEGDVAELRGQVGAWASYGLTSQSVIATLTAQVIQLGGTPATAPPPLPLATRT